MAKKTPYPTPVPPAYDPLVPSREDILSVLRQTKQPLSPEDLAAHFDVSVESIGFNRRLSAMERDGQLSSDKKGMLRLASTQHFIPGKVQGHRDGFGFLIRDDGVKQDVYLSSTEMQKVMHGDRVLVRLSGHESRGKPEGLIVEVLERRNQTLVGRLISERGVFLLVPEDQRINHDVLIPAEELGDAAPGQVVTVEIISHPSRHTQAVGRVLEVLGNVDDPGMEIEIAVRKFEIPHQFSEAALAMADKLPERIRKTDLAGRMDLRDVPFITIDGEDARDFDDAVYAEPVELGNGSRSRPGWRLLVAIADVAHYVTPGSALDHDALERSTSVYFPRRVVPMLPEKLSNGLCSLNPEEDRLVLVCDMVIPASGAKAGTVQAYQFYNAVIYSAARTTYDEVWAALQSPASPAALKHAKVLPQLHNLYSLYQLLQTRRQQRGAMDFDTVETKIVSNALGKIETIVPLVRNDAHKLIEECMLAANTCAADFMERSKHPGLYRVHEGPTIEKLAALRDFLKSIGMTLEGGEKPTPADYAKLFTQAKQRPDAALIQTMALRSMQQAVYSPDNVGHFGLSYPAYTHFTSPIRRYPDLLTHRVIKALISRKRYVPRPMVKQAGGAAEQAEETWDALGMVCSANERRADDASRDVEAWLKCSYMQNKLGEIFTGTVTGVASFGLFVTLDSLYVEGMVHISELGQEYFQFNDVMHELRGERTGTRFRLTDKVQVQLVRVDLDSRRMEFKLVQGVGHQALRRSVSRQGPRTSAERSEKQSEAQQETRLPPPAKKKGTITVKTPGAAPTTGLRTGKRAAAKKRSAR
ncbi:MAG: ribonuclease R [Pigmentiphaga sp.]